ncbi:GTP-binding protein rhoA [Mycena venus]|uniref:GTP-binding protein rhoA n=1 Tax=Mycena venus TaxID=2733690 RepID=A0A8H6XR15_9AGAR|nr:GTP-binding protein rhoA [Mycena venus]
MSMLRRKLVVVGDGACGKTSLLTVFTHNVFLEILPGVLENYVAILEVSSQLIEFALWDTLWQDEYNRLCLLAYPNAHVILICFAVDYLVSLDNSQDKVGPAVSAVALHPTVTHIRRKLTPARPAVGPRGAALWPPRPAFHCRQVQDGFVPRSTGISGDCGNRGGKGTRTYRWGA